jgi:uncharacterized protein YbjT (DUF2867 family)
MYVLLGANGNITSKAARLLRSKDKRVRAVGREAARLQPLKEAGAELAIGDLRQAGFLADVFRGADGVYVMIPPDYASPDHRAYQNVVGEAIATAIAASGVRSVISLSSVGAGLPGGTGPIAGLHDQEERLKKLVGANVLHLRAGYFMENHLHAIPLIKAYGVYPGMIAPAAPIAMTATQDIAAAVAKELVSPSYRGQDVKNLLGQRDVTMREAARVLGTAIGKPDLQYVQADPVQAKAGMVAAGFSQNVAGLFEEMCKALSDGRIAKTYSRDAASTTPTSIEQFAPVFAATYKAGGH